MTFSKLKLSSPLSITNGLSDERRNGSEGISQMDICGAQRKCSLNARAGSRQQISQMNRW
jgi:hypothetical protein